MKPAGRKTGRSGLRRAKPSLALQGFPPGKNTARMRPTKVVFYCTGGIESSLVAKREFEKLLKKSGLQARFSVDYEGFMQRPQEYILKHIERADFVVPMYPAVKLRLEELMKRAKRKPVLIDVGFSTISDQYNEQNYKLLLKKIHEMRFRQ